MKLRIFENKTSKVHSFDNVEIKTKLELEAFLVENGISFDGCEFVVRENKDTLKLPEALLPQLDVVTIMIIPSDHKGGAELSYNEMRKAIKGTEFSKGLGSSPSAKKVRKAYNKMLASFLTREEELNEDADQTNIETSSISTIRAVEEVRNHLINAKNDIDKALSILNSGEITYMNEKDKEAAQLLRESAEFASQIESLYSKN